MNDEDLERLLARYQPAEPDPALAERIRATASDLAAGRGGRTWPWALAAAALLAITAGLHATARPVPADPVAGDPAFAAQVNALAEQFGGGAAARALAESMLRYEAAERERRQPLGEVR